MRFYLLLFLLVLAGVLDGCSSDDSGPMITPPEPDPIGPASIQELMTSFQMAYEDLDFDLYMSLLHPEFETHLQQETMDQFPSVGETLDYDEEERIHQRMFSGEDLLDPDTGAFIPGVHAISIRVFEALDAWKVAKTDTTNPEALTCPYRVDFLFNRGQDQSQMHVEGIIRFEAARRDSVVGGETQTYYQMTGQVDLTGVFKATESNSWGSTKALYR